MYVLNPLTWIEETALASALSNQTCNPRGARICIPKMVEDENHEDAEEDQRSGQGKTTFQRRVFELHILKQFLALHPVYLDAYPVLIRELHVLDRLVRR